MSYFSFDTFRAETKTHFLTLLGLLLRISQL